MLNFKKQIKQLMLNAGYSELYSSSVAERYCYLYKTKTAEDIVKKIISNNKTGVNVHYERLTLEKARKCWESGVQIYCMPSRDEAYEGIFISVYTNKFKDESFDAFVDRYKSVSSKQMRYYTEVYL